MNCAAAAFGGAQFLPDRIPASTNGDNASWINSIGCDKRLSKAYVCSYIELTYAYTGQVIIALSDLATRDTQEQGVRQKYLDYVMGIRVACKAEAYGAIVCRSQLTHRARLHDPCAAPDGVYVAPDEEDFLRAFLCH